MRPWGAGRLLDRRNPGDSLRRMRVHAERSYESNVRRVALAAREIEARAGGRMEPRKARVVRRVGRLGRSPAAAAWLALRLLRRLGGRNETLGIELSLLAAILLRRR